MEQSPVKITKYGQNINSGTVCKLNLDIPRSDTKRVGSGRVAIGTRTEELGEKVIPGPLFNTGPTGTGLESNCDLRGET